MEIAVTSLSGQLEAFDGEVGSRDGATAALVRDEHVCRVLYDIKTPRSDCVNNLGVEMCHVTNFWESERTYLMSWHRLAAVALIITDIKDGIYKSLSLPLAPSSHFWTSSVPPQQSRILGKSFILDLDHKLCQKSLGSIDRPKMCFISFSLTFFLSPQLSLHTSGCASLTPTTKGAITLVSTALDYQTTRPTSSAVTITTRPSSTAATKLSFRVWCSSTSPQIQMALPTSERNMISFTTLNFC